MEYEYHQMPSLEEVKQQIESTYKLTLYARTIDGVHILTQWSPLLIELRWSASQRKGFEQWHLDVYPNEHSKPLYTSGFTGLASLDDVIITLSAFCKRRQSEQLSMF